MNIESEIKLILEAVASGELSQAEAQIKIDELYRKYYSQSQRPGRDTDPLRNIQC